MFKCVLMIGLIIAMLLTGNTQAAEAYYGFIEEPINPRTSAMGSAGTALLNGGGFSFFNPALPSLNRPYVSLEFGRLSEDLGRGQLELSTNFSRWFLGGSFQSQSIEFPYADERGPKDAYGSEQSLMATLSVGIKRERFAIGVAVNGIHDRIANDYSYGLTGSAGAIYKVIPEKMVAGVAILHFYGRNTGFIDSLDDHFRDDELPMNARAGVSWTDSVKGKIPYTISTDIAYSFNHEKLMVPIGGEAWILPMLALRLGKRINHPTDVLTMGIGLKLANINYDVAFIPVRYESDVEMKWTMNLTYGLPFVSKRKLAAQKAIDSSKTISPAVDSLETKAATEDSTNLTPAKTETITDTIKEAGDSIEVRPDTVMMPGKSLSNDGDEGSELYEQLQSEDSAKTVDTQLKNSYEKETFSDSVIMEKVLPPVSDSANIAEEVKADTSRQSDSAFIEKKEEQISVPVDSNTIKD
ncbi:MAG: hypothetical protein GX267_13435 [Fibrobacter sp.]|jgi:hypothetical protein|nr:hypothetical protein [Fibrobacter sp.]